MTPEEFKAELRRQNLTQRELCAEIDYGPGAVSMWATGRKPVPKLVEHYLLSRRGAAQDGGRPGDVRVRSDGVFTAVEVRTEAGEWRSLRGVQRVELVAAADDRLPEIRLTLIGGRADAIAKEDRVARQEAVS